jgi:hypothetical protein
MQLIQGIILGALRASEPVYKLMIKEELYSWFGIITNMDDQDKIKIAASFGHMNE